MAQRKTHPLLRVRRSWWHEWLSHGIGRQDLEIPVADFVASMPHSFCPGHDLCIRVRRLLRTGP